MPSSLLFLNFGLLLFDLREAGHLEIRKIRKQKIHAPERTDKENLKTVNNISSLQICLSIFPKQIKNNLAGNPKVLIFMIVRARGNVNDLLKPCFLSLETPTYIKSRTIQTALSEVAIFEKSEHWRPKAEKARTVKKHTWWFLGNIEYY